MLETMDKLYLDKKAYQTYKVLLEKVKQDLEINEETDDKNQMKFTINHEGNKAIKNLSTSVAGFVMKINYLVCL